MNKLVIVLFMVLVLVGCSDKSISLIGEGISWKGEYTANITEGDRENGKYTFSYKYETDNGLKNLEITINGKVVRKESDYKERIIEIQRSCAGCIVTDETKPIEVEINWNDNNKEFFQLSN